MKRWPCSRRRLADSFAAAIELDDWLAWSSRADPIQTRKPARSSLRQSGKLLTFWRRKSFPSPTHKTQTRPAYRPCWVLSRQTVRRRARRQKPAGWANSACGISSRERSVCGRGTIPNKLRGTVCLNGHLLLLTFLEHPQELGLQPFPQPSLLLLACYLKPSGGRQKHLPPAIPPPPLV